MLAERPYTFCNNLYQVLSLQLYERLGDLRLLPVELPAVVPYPLLLHRPLYALADGASSYEGSEEWL